MYSFMITCGDTKELIRLNEISKRVSSVESEDEWKFILAQTIDRMMLLLDSNPVVDFACVDVTLDRGIIGAKRLRSTNSNTQLLIIADTKISPTDYISPDIMASSLLLRPFDNTIARQVLTSMMRSYLSKFAQKKDSEEVFIIDNRDGRQIIPYSLISCFEARNKKIAVVADGKEYYFYDTIDNLEAELPDTFLRCHRSFIVNGNRITNIVRSQNIIYLDNGETIPLSRSYKEVFKSFGGSRQIDEI